MAAPKIFRTLLLCTFALSLSFCTKKSDDKTPPPVTTPAPEAGNDASATPPAQTPKIDGIEVTGEKFEPEGTAFLVDELKIAEPGGKVLDEYSLLDWGPVKILIENQTLRTFPNGEIFEIDYKVGATKKIERTTKCPFTIPDNEQKVAYGEAVKSANDPNVNWETFYHVDMQDLASGGNKYAYNFFMKPDAQAKKLGSHNQGAASFDAIIRVLKFMKANGCKW